MAPSERPPGEFCAIAGIRAAMDAFAASGALPVRAPPARPGGGQAPFAFSTVNWFCTPGGAGGQAPLAFSTLQNTTQSGFVWRFRMVAQVA